MRKMRQTLENVLSATRRKTCVFLIVAMLLPLGAAATDWSEDLSELEAPLAGLLATEIGSGMAYPAQDDAVTSEYARTYLFYMANIFYIEDAALREVPDGFDQYVLLDQEEVALLLKWAFGARIEPDDLASDGRMLLVDDEGYWLGVADGYVIEMTYADAMDDAGYLFDFEITYDDGGEQIGQLSVVAQSLKDEDVPLCVGGYLRLGAEDAQGLNGNYYANDGYWCSLMGEEGLIFCFDDGYNVIAEGTFAFEDDTLKMTLNGEAAQAEWEASVLKLSIDGVDRQYVYEP